MSNTLVDRVRAAGVVGAGGAGFPTHVKLAATADTVIANGTECEPLLAADQALMATRADRVLEGMRLAMECTGAATGIIAIKRHYHHGIAAFERLLPSYPGIRLQLFDSFYPAGDEFVVVYDCTGRQVPETGIPLDVGIVVQNVTTLHNIAAAAEGAPVISRMLTVAGEIMRPATVEVPVGTFYEDLVDYLGGYRDVLLSGSQMGELALVEGGAMMGRVVAGDNVVKKTTSGLLVLPTTGPVVTQLTRRWDSTIRRGRSACDQCRDCSDLCPRTLLGHELHPHEIMRSINYNLDTLPRTVTAAVLCCECRLCEAFACPLELSPVAYYQQVKQQLWEQGFKNDIHKRKDLTPHSMRDFRRVPTSRLEDRLGLAPYRQQQYPLLPGRFEPRRVRIPLKMNIGAPATPVVGVGRRVAQGELVAAIPEGKLSACIHASIDGTVTEVTDKHIHIERSG